MADWNAFDFSLSIPIAAILAVRFFVPLYNGIGIAQIGDGISGCINTKKIADSHVV